MLKLLHRFLFFFLLFSFSLTAQNIVTFSQIAVSDSNMPRLKSALSKDGSKRNIALFIGDFKGELSNEELINSLKEISQFTHKVFLVPGKKEWADWGAEGITAFEDTLKEIFDYDMILTDNACGELDKVELENNLVLIGMDSEWYLRNWQNADQINKECEVDTRLQFWKNLSEQIGSYREKTVLLLSYHPPIRYDNNAGYFTVEDHLFPLRKIAKPLYIPLPFIGSLILNGDAYITDRKKITHPIYREFADKIADVVDNNPNVIVVSGEANHLMLADFKKSLVINSYTGEDPNFLRKKLTTFGSSTSGYVMFDKLADSLKISFQSISTQLENKVLFQKTYSDRKEITDKMDRDYISLMERIEKYEPVDTSILQKGDIYEMNGFLWGHLNTDIFYRKIKTPRLYLNSFKGGVTPVRIGGGQQTKSLRLLAKDGRSYNLRSIRKFPNNILPGFFDFSIARNLLAFHFTSANPYGFLSAPVLQKAANVLYTEPEMCYLPIQKALQPYNEEIGEELYMIRIRADGDWTNNSAMGSTDEFEGTSDLLEKLKEGKAEVDEEMYLRARLIDLLINDWDRHEDQWRWAMVGDKNGKDFYQPIPRDRDQAFANFDGFLLRFLFPYNLDTRRFWPYKEKINNLEVRWTHYQAKYLDNVLLGRLGKESFVQQAEQVKESLSEEIIEQAVNKMPEAVTLEEKNELIKLLKARRKNVIQTSEYLYNAINRTLFLFGTYERDSIFINRFKNGDLEIKFFHQNKTKEETNSTNNTWLSDYSRIINAKQTKQIILMSLSEDDKFVIRGRDKGPRIHIVGGYGDDSYSDQSKGFSFQKKNIIYEDNKESNFETNGNSRLKFTNSKVIHEVNRDIFKQPYNLLGPVASYTTDDGIYLGGKVEWTNFTYRTMYKSSLKGLYAFGTGSSELKYNLVIDNDLKKRLSYFNFNFLGPQYVFNYFGQGNETIANTSIDRNFYFVRQRRIESSFGYINNLNDIGTISYGVGLYSTKVENTIDRFISEVSDINSEVFKTNYFATSNISLDFKNLDKNLRPNDGVLIHAEVIPKIQLNGNRSHIRMDAEFGLYESLDRNNIFVFSTKFGGSHIIGDYYFFDGVKLGGRNNLRGYRDERFNGRTGFYHNTNLNIQLFKKILKGVFPSSLGVTLSFDHGRVWADSDTENDPTFQKWRRCYGASIYLAPFSEVVLSGGIFTGSEDAQVSFQFGYFF